MLLVLDNYDSFTYNLVQYAGELGAEPVVYRNDALERRGGARAPPRAIVVSPGPCTPREAGISVALIRAAAGRVPVLGVCLGHQAIGEAFGGQVVRADRLMHGKTTLVAHTGHPLFAGNPRALRGDAVPLARGVARGAARRSSRSRPGPTTARRAREIMALCHRTLPVYGVQFHPESVGTVPGKRLLANFLAARQPKPIRLSKLDSFSCTGP